MISTVDIVRWWKEYFQDLLDPADMLTLVKSGDEGYDSPITVDNEVAKKLSGGLGPGVDEICPEFLKALDVVGLSWLTRLCSITWNQASGLPDWDDGLRTGTGKGAPSSGALHSCSLGRSTPGCCRGESAC